MAAAETTTETEQERIERWRAEELERAGYESSAASCSPAGPTSICTTRSTCSETVVLRSSRSKSCSDAPIAGLPPGRARLRPARAR